MSANWITDRRPTEKDADVHNNVYNRFALYTHWTDIDIGQPWMPIEPPDPYVKAKRWEVIWDGYNNCWKVRDTTFEFGGMVCNCLRTQEHREAAERIAAIYEEVMP